jgi:hypothetical protein
VLPKKIREIISDELTEQISYSAIFRFQNISELAKIITNLYEFRKIQMRYQNLQKSNTYLFKHKSCIINNTEEQVEPFI